MIDLHTHLLPDWDDGAKDWEEMQKMTEIAYKDGIRKIALTPHIYRMNKHNDNLTVLRQRILQFKEKRPAASVSFYRGAEVFVHHEIIANVKKYNLTINNSNYFFIEFPSDYIMPGVKELFFNIMLEGLIPVISHPERNMVFGERPDFLYELIKMDCLAQVTAKSITGDFGPGIKRTAHLFMANNLVHFIASDAHDAERRPPQLSEAFEEARKIVGDEKAQAMVTSIPQAILDNKDIGDWGEAVNPIKKKKWAIRLPQLLKKEKEEKE